MAPTTDELQTQIDAMKAFIGIDGYQAGQRRLRDAYRAKLEDTVAESQVILDQPEDTAAKLTALENIAQTMVVLKDRIDFLDRQLGPAETGNRATRRRARK